MDNLVEGSKVDFALDTTTSEELVTAYSVRGEILLFFLGHTDLEALLVSRYNSVDQVLTHLLLESS